MFLNKNEYLCTRILKMSAENGDPLAQSVEHHTFNVGVLGSNPKRITKDGLKPSFFHFIRYTYIDKQLREITIYNQAPIFCKEYGGLTNIYIVILNNYQTQSQNTGT